MGDSSKAKRGEAREFWEAAIRLWSESGLSVRGFCRREGLAESAFYFWRRKLLPENPGREASAGGDMMAGVGRRGKAVAGGKSKESADAPEKNIAVPFIELASPASAGVCCMLELENACGAKMRVELQGFTATDVAAIGRSFWRVEP